MFVKLYSQQRFISSSKTYCIVLKEDVTPLVLHQEEEGEDGGEEDEEHADHHHQAAVKHPAKNPRGIMVNGTVSCHELDIMIRSSELTSAPLHCYSPEVMFALLGLGLHL